MMLDSIIVVAWIVNACVWFSLGVMNRDYTALLVAFLSLVLAVKQVEVNSCD